MYVVGDDKDKVIAFHDEKRVVKRYVENYNSCNDSKLKYYKMKKSIAKKELKYKEDLYLVKYRSTYIQSGYYDYCRVAETDNLSELYETKDVLFKLLEVDFSMLDKKDIKHISGAINVINRLIEEEKKYTPNMRELKTLKDNIDIYNRNVYY